MVTERARTYFKWLALTAALMCVAWFATQLGMNYAGYCRADRRFLSDAERINRVVELELSVYPPVVSLEKTDARGKPPIWTTSDRINLSTTPTRRNISD